METKRTGRRPIGEIRMTQSDYSRRYREKMKRTGNPTGDDMKTITFAALKGAWINISYQTVCSLHGAVRREAVERGFDPDAAESKFRESMTQ